MELRDRAHRADLAGPGRGGRHLPPGPHPPRRSEENLQITVFQPPTRLAVQGQLGPFRATASYLLEPVPGGTRLANDVELEPIPALLRPISPLAVPRVNAAVARNLGTLKELLESTHPAAQVSP
ncbi:MAG TPA: SRPBCC family protein [Streptosporangiaceae bacterium]|nr:SRPBCC family protein [Streptosporangiaceae bacterium]